MKRLIAVLLLIAACSTPPPPAPSTAPPATSTPPTLGSARVAATALNVRAEPSPDADVLTTLRRNDSLTLLEERNGWFSVKLASGQTGWVSSQYVSRGDAPLQAPRRRGGCAPDADYAFEKAPTPSFSESGAHGMVIIEASVNTNGDVTSTRIMSNTTADTALAALAEREIRSAKFIAPVRNCVPQRFVFTYKRAF